MRRVAAPALLASLVLVLGVLPAQGERPARVGEVRSHRAGTPHPYPRGAAHRPVVWTETVYSPGATFLRIHFQEFDLAEGDFVAVSQADGSQTRTYRGRGPRGTGSFWAFAVPGDTARVTLHAGLGTGYGYEIDSIGHGTRPLGGTPEVACGVDGREDVACHLPELAQVEGPIARLSIVTSDGFLVSCTGWLVAGTSDDLLITNHHCVSSSSEVSSLQATFNFQSTTCGGSSLEPTSDYLGDRLLRTNSLDRKGKKGGLDYSLVSLLGNPEAAWGELTATVEPASVGDSLWLPQHPGGWEKKVGYYENEPGGPRCDVDAVGQTYGSSAQGSQLGYSCDTSAGSSGSPVIDPSTGRVFALHHFGSVDNDPCLNGGTSMRDICADAGALLRCHCASGLPSGAACAKDADCCSSRCTKSRGRKTCE